MALPATHLRFAVDLADRFAVQSRRRYLSGTLYPDSRCLTGVDRQVSHLPACCRPDFIQGDFTLGWHLHCRCDQIQTDLFLAAFPDVARWDEDRRWLHLSVLKMLQDREDMTALDLDAALAHLTCVQTPNGESPKGVQAYLDLVRGIYGGKKRLDMDDYHALWIGVGLALPKAAMLMAEAGRMGADPDLIRQLRRIHPQSMARFLENAP